MSRRPMVQPILEEVNTVARGHTPGAQAQRLYTVKEAAAQLRLGQTKLYQLIARRELAAIHIGRATRIPSAALDEFVEMLRADHGI